MKTSTSTCRLGAALLLAVALTATASAQIFVASLGLNRIEKYNPNGSLVNANFITGLSSPNGLVLSGADLYVVNQAAGTVGKYTTAGATVNAALLAGLNFPYGIAVSGTDLYVVNEGSGTIGKYTTAGATVNASLITGLNDPRGIAVSGTSLYVAITDNGNSPRVAVFTTAGVLVNPALIAFPVGTPIFEVVVSGTDLYVMINGSPGRVEKYTTGGVLVNGSLVTGLTALGRIAVSEGDLYVSAQGVSPNVATVGKYTTAGGIVNASLIAGLNSAYGIAIGCASIYEPYCFTNLAGSALNPGNTPGTGTAAQFSQPWGVAVDGAGNAFVADTQNHSIRQISPGGVVTLLAGSGTAGFVDATGSAAEFSRPTGVAVNSAGTRVYVADYNTERVRMITVPGGVVTTIAGIGTAGSGDGDLAVAQFRNPFGVAFDAPRNLLYVSDQNNQTIRKIDLGQPTTSAAYITTFAGTSGVGGYLSGASLTVALFNTPRGIAVDSLGDVYVADSGNFTVRKISGGFVTTIAGHPFTPFLDGCDDGPGGSARFSALFAFSPFGGPTGVAVDNFFNVYVTDQGNHTIRKITPAGNVTTLAGLAHASGSTDGTGSAALFNSPAGIAVDGAGRLYVADTLNHTIRRQCDCDPAAIMIGLYAGLTIQGSIGCQYRIDYTTFLNSNPSLTVWTPLTTLTLTSSPFLYVDTTVVSGSRFYRAVALP